MCAQLAVHVCNTVYMLEMGILCRASEKQVEVDFWQSLLGKRHDRCQDILSWEISLSLYAMVIMMCIRLGVSCVPSCNIAILSENFCFLLPVL